MLSVDIVIVLLIVGCAIVLFVTEWVRYDGVALIVLLALAISGVIPMSRAIEGFANPAVVTIAAVLVLSGGLYRTGVANLIGTHLMRFTGASPMRLTAVMMLTAGLMSGVMNNIAATALLLPVVLDIARRFGMRPSRLLIPLAFASLLGGMTTLIGTGPNILLSTILERSGHGTFGLFSFTPVGSAALVLGILYMIFLGRHFLPDRRSKNDQPIGEVDFRDRYALGEAIFCVRIPKRSTLNGRTLVEAQLGRVLGIDLLAVQRAGQLIRAPEPGFQLRNGDVLICEGRPDKMTDLQSWGYLRNQGQPDGSLRQCLIDHTTFAKAEVTSTSSIIGKTPAELDFHRSYSAHIMAIERGGNLLSGPIAETQIKSGDVLLMIGEEELLEQLYFSDELTSIVLMNTDDALDLYQLHTKLMETQIPSKSALNGRSLDSARFGHDFGLTVLQIQRKQESQTTNIILPDASEAIYAGDRLIVQGSQESFKMFRGLQSLEFHDADAASIVEDLESEDVGFAEVTLSPTSNLVGKSLSQIFFRDSYGLNIPAIWRSGETTHSNIHLSETPLQFGDALLVYGRRKKIRLLEKDTRFLVLTSELSEVFRTRKAPIAGMIMFGVILCASMNLLPVYIAVLLGALGMVFTGCVRGNEVYKLIEWRVIILLGGMLALGLAMEESGAAELFAREVVGRAAEAGPSFLIGSLFLLCAFAAQFVPTSAVAVLVAPIALSTAAELNLSAQALLMVVAVGSSCAFLTPFGHPVNLLVMSVGGYKVTDYTRAGAPLFVLLLLLVVFLLPVIWPL